MKSRLALRIEVSGYRARAALPVLVELLQAHGAGASFIFALGPDWLGRSLAHHCADALKQVRDAGFDLGTFGWQSGRWAKQVGQADASWIETQFRLMTEHFAGIFATAPTLHAAPGWRSSPHALRLTQRFAYACASDTRGRHPFVPVWNGELIRCPQIPTTLPTLDELRTSPRHDPAETVAALLALTANPPRHGHVFSLRASAVLGNDLVSVRQLLVGWHEQGYEVVSVQALAGPLDMDKLPRHEVISGQMPGCKDAMLLQGDEFLSAWRCPA